MTTSVIVVVAIALLVVTVRALLQRRRVRRLGERFRLEHQHVAADEIERAEPADGPTLAIRPLDPGVWAEYSAAWQEVQAQFADSPAAAVADAERLVLHVMRHRGYRVDELEQRAAEISADHPSVVTDYRAAHDVSQLNELGEATDDDLRRAMVHYHALFEVLLAADPNLQALSEVRSG